MQILQINPKKRLSIQVHMPLIGVPRAYSPTLFPSKESRILPKQGNGKGTSVGKVRVNTRKKTVTYTLEYHETTKRHCLASNRIFIIPYKGHQHRTAMAETPFKSTKPPYYYLQTFHLQEHTTACSTMGGYNHDKMVETKWFF